MNYIEEALYSLRQWMYTLQAKNDPEDEEVLGNVLYLIELLEVKE